MNPEFTPFLDTNSPRRRQGKSDIAKIVNPTTGDRQKLCHTRRTGGIFHWIFKKRRSAHSAPTQPQYAIHLSPAGVFLRSPDIFQDYDASHATRTLQQDLNATSLCEAESKQDEPFWKCFSDSFGGLVRIPA